MGWGKWGGGEGNGVGGGEGNGAEWGNLWFTFPQVVGAGGTRWVGYSVLPLSPQALFWGRLNRGFWATYFLTPSPPPLTVQVLTKKLN